MIPGGVAAVLDGQGRSDFALLQNSLGANGRQGGKLPSGNANLYAFDRLYLDGHDPQGVEYKSRRHLLEDTLRGQDCAIRFSDAFDADPDHRLRHACAHGLKVSSANIGISPIDPAAMVTK